MEEDARIGPPASHVLEENVREDVLLYDTGKEEFVSLNSTAGDVWRLATGELTVDGIVDKLASSYQVPADSIRADVAATVEQLIGAGLLQRGTDS